MNNSNNKFKNNKTYQEILKEKERLMLERQKYNDFLNREQDEFDDDEEFDDEEFEDDEDSSDDIEDTSTNDSESNSQNNKKKRNDNQINIQNSNDSSINKPKTLTKKNPSGNKLSNFKNKKTNVVNKTKKTARTAKRTAKATKDIARSIYRFISLIFGKYKWIALIILVLLFMFFLSTFLLLLAAGGGNSNTGIGGKNKRGYWSFGCDFNKTTVKYDSSSGSYSKLSLNEFIIGSVYAYTKDENINEEGIKTLIVLLKTNALSYGNYSNWTQKLSLTDEHIKYEVYTEEYLSKYENIEEIYNEVDEELYLASSKTGKIKNLVPEDALLFTDDTIEQIKDLSSSSNYAEILNKLYNQSNNKSIYKIANNCTYYTITDNELYWWPIGGADDKDNDGIYDGKPTGTTVLDGGRFGWRTIDGNKHHHDGLDISIPCQTNVVIAAKDGEVYKVHTGCDNNGGFGNRCGNGYGNNVRIDHGDGMVTFYAHLYPDSITVKEGDKVKQGQIIGLVGNSGSSTGCHLHYEMQLNGEPVDPLGYISAEDARPIKSSEIPDIEDGVMSPELNKSSTCEILLNAGYSENAVAGMLVNISHEGGFVTNNLENCYETNRCCDIYDSVPGPDYGYCIHPEIGVYGSDDAYTEGVDSGSYPKETYMNDRAGYGLIQWTSSNRKAGLYDKAKSKSKSISNLGVQLEWLLQEIDGYAITYKYVTGNYSVEEITTNFCLDFESPADEEIVCLQRARNEAQSMLEYVKNGCS